MKNIDECININIQALIENGFIKNKNDLSPEDLDKLKEIIENAECFDD